ncbi:GAF domain-containing hybrid sensor histidine kinase/response regulator [Schlesneria paludicola]|uniref:GAF domain-containing hybrid sensor histidine kinase/response regulator n=1 Tax=Schlesneria paludicola TaxID=360056 RepID=UPI00029A2AF2|nr:PAS domain-containing protein [Schlesneria paludicola]
MFDSLIEIDSQLSVLETLFQNAPVGFSFVDRDFRYVRINDAFAAINGRSVSFLVGRRVSEIMPSLWPTLEPLYFRALAGETIVNYDIRGVISSTSHELRNWSMSFYPVRRHSEIIGIGVVVTDITDQKRTEESLRVRNNLYAMLSRTNHAVSRCRSREELFQEICQIAVQTGCFRCAWVGIPDGGLVRKIAMAGEDGGYLDELVITLSDDDIRSHGPTGRAAVNGRCYVVNDFLASSMTAPWHERARQVGFRASAAFPLKEHDQVAAVLTIYADTPGFFTDDLVTTISEITPSVSFALDKLWEESNRKRDEEALLLRDRAIRAASQGIVITDPRRNDNPIIYASPGFERLTGYTAKELVGKNCRMLQGELTDPAAVARIREAVHAGQGCTVELVNYRKNGKSFWNHLALSAVFDENQQLVNFVGVQTDVTERRSLEEQVRHVQKIDAIGQLAGGIAHDFSNLLTLIHGATDLLLTLIRPEDSKRRIVEAMHLAADRTAGMTRQLLAFSRKQAFAPQVLDLNVCVRETENMLRHIVGEDVQLYSFLSPIAGHVKIDPGQLQQVLLNLVINARDAMPCGGKITVMTSDVNLEDARFQSLKCDRTGHYVMLTVTDTGSGISEDVKSRLFEPFFTTKEQGKGTGLGLPMVHGILQQCGGMIDVQSEVGAGTTFRIFLPTEVTASPTPVEQVNHEFASSGNETLLVAEDDDAVRTLTRVSLQARGYTVLEARHADEALRVVTQHQNPVHLLITDVVMPGVGGRILAELLQAMHPQMGVLYVSGYTDDAVIRHGIQNEHVNFLQKPYSMTSLAAKIREVLTKRAD